MQGGSLPLAGRARSLRQVPRSGGGAAIRVLAVTPHEQDRISLETILRPPSCRLVSASCLKEALAMVATQGFSVAICERDLLDGDWKVLLERLAGMARGPKLIVCSRLADYRLWGEVLNLGGYDVLITPFVREEVLRIVGQAAGVMWTVQP